MLAGGTLEGHEARLLGTTDPPRKTAVPGCPGLCESDAERGAPCSLFAEAEVATGCQGGPRQ